MAEEIDFHFETSSDEEEFEGFTTEDVIQGARLYQINDDKLSDISLDVEDEDEDESNESENDDGNANAFILMKESQIIF